MTAMAIEREINDARSIPDMGASDRRRRVSLLLVRERRKRIMFHEDFKDRAATIRAKAELRLLVRKADDMLPFP